MFRINIGLKQEKYNTDSTLNGAGLF